MPDQTGSLVATIPADYGIRRLLRPYTGFQTDYQGVDSNTPIHFTEVYPPDKGGLARDELAKKGEEGYDPNLVNGLPCPMGARVLLWLPKLIADNGEGSTQRYTWRLCWRLRNVRDYRLNRQDPYHIQKGVDGVNDGSTPADPERVVIAAAEETVFYAPTEPAGITTRVTLSGRISDLSLGGDDLPLPLVPVSGGAAVAGAIQQGLLDPNVTATATQPFWMIYETRAKGDELLIGIYRSGVDTTWNFTAGVGIDQNLRFFFQSSADPIFPDLGVYAFFGTAT